MSNHRRNKWFGISGTWQIVNADLERDVRTAVREIVSRGDGIVTGGAMGVDYFAVDEAMSAAPDGQAVKVVLPSSLENYLTHIRKWAEGYETGDAPITDKEAYALIKQLTFLQLKNPTAIIETPGVSLTQINKDTYFARNTTIAEMSDELIAFQVNRSVGTQDTIDKARLMGKEVQVNSYSV